MNIQRTATFLFIGSQLKYCRTYCKVGVDLTLAAQFVQPEQTLLVELIGHQYGESPQHVLVHHLVVNVDVRVKIFQRDCLLLVYQRYQHGIEMGLSI